MTNNPENSNFDRRMEPADLITSAQQGNQESMERLVKLAEPRLLTYIFRLTLSKDLAEELCQKTLVKLVESLDTLENVNGFWNWLLRHAMGEVRHYYRDRKRRREVEMELLNEDYFKEFVRRNHHDGLEEASRIELADIIYDAIAQLRIAYRNVLILRCYEELSFAEIAEFMDCKELRARVLFFRAKHALKQQLHNSGFGKETLLTGLGLFGILTSTGKGAVTISSVKSASLNIGTMATIAGTMGTRAGVAAVTTTSAIIAGLTSQHVLICLAVVAVVLLGIVITNFFVALD